MLAHVPLTGGIEYAQLASLASVPESQLKRVSRMAILNGFLSEPQPGLVAHNPISAALAKDPSYMNWARWMVNYSVPTAYKLFEATNRWGRTEVKNETAFNLAMGTDQPFFDLLRTDSKMNTMFSGYMRVVTSSEGASSKHLVEGFDWASLPDGATVVDVGGSGGHSSIAIAERFPRLNFVVQDLPETIANAQKSFSALQSAVKDRIRFMAHDFFQPQPLVDADVFLLRMIIHDWPDIQALTILRNLRQMLRKAKARIIIMDTVLPQPGTIAISKERQLRVKDLTMMQVFNAREREFEDWEQLIQQAGLKLFQIKQPEKSNMAILELGLCNDGTLLNGEQAITASVNGGYAVTVPNGTVPDGTIPESETEAQAKISTSQDKVNGKSTVTGPNTEKKLPVLIVGAGIGGLCLAQGLRKAGVDVMVLEKDQSESYRPQGYRLKLEADAAEALRESLPVDVYEAFEASCAISTFGESDFEPITGSCIRSRVGGGLAGSQGLRATYTVDRAVFRRMLMSGIEDAIVFGKELTSFKESVKEGTSSVIAHFRDGTHAEGRFLVGADGSRSVVRRQHLPSHKIVDTGAVCIYGKTNITPSLLERYPERALQWMTVCADVAPLIQSILIGDSPLTLLSEPIRFSTKARSGLERLPDDYVYWVLIGRKELFVDSSSGILGKPEAMERQAEDSARQSLELTREWHPALKSLFELQEVQQCSTMRVLSATPNIPSWNPSALVTLIGDSIHVMSPCGGVGANTALRDAAQLVKVIADSKEQALRSEDVGLFEKNVRERAFRSLMRSYVGSKRMFDQRPFDELPQVDV